MKSLILTALFACVHISYAEDLSKVPLQNCARGSISPNSDTVKTDEQWDSKFGENSCTEKMVNHVKMEFTASLTYLELSAYFSSELNYRPRLANFFLKSASEERDHAKEFIKYILMRGGKFDTIPTIESKLKLTEKGAGKLSVMNALKKAFVLENTVTESIRDVANACENTCKRGTVCDENNPWNDYQAVDYLTGTFLTEQHESLRTIAGYIASLEQLLNRSTTTKLHEILFDKSLPDD